MFRLISILGFIALALECGKARSADVIPLPLDSLECLIEHQEVYLNLPRALIIFFPVFCPSIEREEIARLVENSADPSEQPTQQLIISKADFTCLISKIETHLAKTQETSEDDGAMVSFALDCQ